MKYLLLTLLCSLSVAQAMEHPLIRTLKQEKLALKLELDAASRAMFEGGNSALCAKTIRIFKNRLTEVIEILEWIKEANPTEKGVLHVCVAYEKNYRCLMRMPTKTQKFNTCLEAPARSQSATVHSTTAHEVLTERPYSAPPTAYSIGLPLTSVDEEPEYERHALGIIFDEINS